MSDLGVDTVGDDRQEQQNDQNRPGIGDYFMYCLTHSILFQVNGFIRTVRTTHKPAPPQVCLNLTFLVMEVQRAEMPNRE